MTIDKAIEILNDIRNINLNHYSPDRKDALKLGIEALKREKGNRASPDYVLAGPLPGETGD